MIKHGALRDAYTHAILLMMRGASARVRSGVPMAMRRRGATPPCKMMVCARAAAPRSVRAKHEKMRDARRCLLELAHAAHFTSRAFARECHLFFIDDICTFQQPRGSAEARAILRVRVFSAMARRFLLPRGACVAASPPCACHARCLSRDALTATA